MENKSMVVIPAIIMSSLFLSGCELIGSIFKAGVWTGIIAVVIILAIIIFIVVKMFSKNK